MRILGAYCANPLNSARNTESAEIRTLRGLCQCEGMKSMSR